MRSTVFAAAAALALWALPLAGALAQDDTPSRAAHDVASARLPKAPVPYAKLRAKPSAPKPITTEIPSPAAPNTEAKTDTISPAAEAIVTADTVPAATAAAKRVAPGAKLSAGQAMPAAELEAFVDGLLRDAMAREHIAGATVAIVQNGQVVLKKGYGFASLSPRRPVDPNQTLFRVGSISKTFTWIALMKEVEAGRIRLNQPINLYLPEKVQVKDQGYDQPVRVENLMDHSTGFEDRAFGQLMERDYNQVRPLDLYLRQERPKRVHAPGAVSSYSNYAAALAGEAVTYTSGKPYERLIEDEILVPLGMAHSTLREPHPAKAGLPAPMPANLVDDISEGYRWTPLGFMRRDFEFIGQAAPAGAASSTASDMARFMLMQLGDGRLGSATIYGPATAQAFRSPLLKTPVGINGWAHGLMVFDLSGGYRGYGHGGATMSFFSNMVVVPDLNLGVFISTNTDTGRPLAARLPEQIVQQFYAPPQLFPRTGSPDLAERRKVFAGYYLTTRRAYSGLEGFVDQLTGGANVDVTRDGRLLTKVGGAIHTWVPEGGLDQGRFIETEGSERLAFDMRDDRARAFHPASGTQLFERAPFWRKPLTLAILTALAATAAMVTIAGVVLRNRRKLRENQIQSRASLVQTIQAVLWLLALALFSLWAAKIGDVTQIMYRWPGALILTASACALVAAGLTATTFLALPAIWRGGRRVDSWTHLRKAYFTLTLLIYGAFSIDLGIWGALSPWSG